MIPCCERCYAKYLTEAGDVKEAFLIDTFGSDAKVTLDQPEPSDITRALRAKGHDVEVPVTATVTTNGASTPLCMCKCHREGWSVFH
jgi:hypothetical protein